MGVFKLGYEEFIWVYHVSTCDNVLESLGS